MDKHYTLMIIPEKEKGVKSFKIPGLLFRSFSVVLVLVSILVGILLYDYWKVIGQIHENKHLTLENRQLREQIQLFQMKINSLSEDLERVHTFEKKLRIITGLEDAEKAAPIMQGNENMEMMDDHSSSSSGREVNNEQTSAPNLELNLNFSQMFSDSQYLELKSLYDKKIAANLGFSKQYEITRQWSDLIKKSFSLSNEYAKFDYKFGKIKNVVSKLENNIHELDQYLLDKNSILRSTPTILPSVGWITSYFGHRVSPYAGKVKMHEGLDVGAPFGTPIVAPADGVITFAGHKPGFGNFVQIDHGYGIETIYAHAQKVIAKNGQRIKRGNLIAKVGSTGYSTGPHLHYEVRVNGIAVDPLYFVLE
ncbi:MAG: M23 family metallopeptidase [Bacteriovoracaceae bacterium]|nr:M23 family metallopeptidase [Bacteriovoracaceae bacterium]